VTSLFYEARGDKCEEIFLKKEAVVEKRRMVGQTGGPSRKRRKVAKTSKAVEAALAEEGVAARDIVGSVIDELLAAVSESSKSLTVCDEEFYGVMVSMV
jgi:hypothetical protein